MKLKDFKEILKQAGSSYEELRNDFVNDNQQIKECIKGSVLPSDVLEDIIDFVNFKQYDVYTKWDKILKKITNIELVASCSEVVDDHEIFKNGEYWVVGCQKISKKQRLKLFQLLAEDLGYEIQ